MKDVKTYICMFLMIMGTCASAWGGITISPMNLSFSGVLTDESVTPAAKQLSCTTTEEWWSVYFTNAEISDFENINWVHVSGDEIVYDVEVKATYGAYVDDNYILFPSAQTIQANVSVTAIYAGTERIKLYAQINNNNFDLVETKEIIIDVTITEPGTPHNITYHYPDCASNKPSNESNVAAGAHALPTGVNVDGYTFEGWTENGSYADGTSAPTTLYTSSFTMPGDRDVELHAVYSKTQSTAASAITWSLTSAEPLVAGNYVISNGQYATGDGTNKVMDNEMTSRGLRIAAKDITMSGSKITSEVTSVAWQFAKNGDYWTIYNPYAKKYVAATANDKEATLVSDVTDAALWTITKSSSTYNIISKSRASETAKYLKYNSSSDAWGCYSTNSAIFLYKTDVNPFEGSTTYTINPQCTTYSVTYNVNGGTGSVPTDANKYAQGATAIVLGNVNGMTKDGFAFAGWATSSDATSATYHSGSELEIGDRDVTLYAVWSQVVTITYKDQGNVDCTAENIDDLPTEHVTGSGNTALVAGTKTNYYFRGWYYTSACDGDAVTEIPSDRNSNLTLYAKWEAMYTDYRWKCESYTVTYHDAEGERSEEVDKDAHPTGMDARACSDENRVFVGWSETEIAEAVQTAPATVDPTTVTISAEKHFYAVYASKNGGKVTGSETKKASNIHNTLFDAHATTVENFDFGSATYSNATGTENWLSLDFKNQTNHLTTKNKINDLSAIEVTWRANGANANNVEIRISEDAEQWTTIQTVSSVSTSSSANPRFDLPTVGDYYVEIFVPARDNGTDKLLFSNVSFYSKARTFYYTDYASSCEKAASMTLNYVTDGGTAQTAVTEAGWVTLPDGDACERGCYTLSGWLCSGDELTYEPGAKYLFNHDVTMTAQWAVDDTHAVTVKYFTGLEGAPVEGVTVAGKYCGSTLTDIPTPEDCDVNDNKVFVGWSASTFADTETQPTLVDLSAPINDNINLYAVWRIGKSVYRKYTDSPADYSGTYILIDHKDAEHPMALSATLEPIQIEYEADGTIVTDEHYLTWTVVKNGDTYSLQGINGYLNITADNARAVALSDDAVTSWNIAESSTNGVYNIGLTPAGGTAQRNVNFNTKRKMWASYKTNSSGYLYKLSGGEQVAQFTMVGACEHVYNAAEISPITSTKDVASRSVKGMVIVENPVNHDNVPYAVISGANAGLFNVSVTKSARHENSDGSYNYDYVVTYTPNEYDAIHTATITFQDAETKGEYVVASEPITVQGRSLPKEFAIAVKVGDDYIALPGTMGGSTLSPTTIVESIGEKYYVADSYRYHLEAVGAESTSHKDDESVWLTSSTGRLWIGASTMKNVTDAGTNWECQALSLETEDMVTYLVSSQYYPDNALMYHTYSGGDRFGNYDQGNASHADYYGDIVFLPIAAETGEKMDIVDWDTNGIILNMNGVDASKTVTAAVNGGAATTLTEGNHYSFQNQPDRTYEVATGTLEAGDYLHLTTTYYAGQDSVSDRYYKIPYIYTGGEVSKADFTATDEIVIRSGKVTLSGAVAVNKVTIYPGAELVVSGSLTCNEMYIRTTAFQSGAVSGSITVPAGKTYYTRIVADKANYFLFALPLESQLSNADGYTTVTATTGDVFKLNKHFRLKTYDAEKRATSGATGDNWVNVGQRLTNDKIVARQGYEILSASAYYREYLFPVTYQNVAAGAESALTYYAGEKVQDNGWNQICSPYTGVYTQNLGGSPEDAVKFSELTEDNTTYWQHVMTTMWPAQSVFYQAPEAGKLVFGDMISFVASASVAARAAKAEDEPKVATQWLVLNLTNESGLSDETNFYLHPTKFSVDYEAQYDLEKMLGYAARPQLYSQMACGNLAFNALPDSVAETRIPLGTYVATAGEMTFSLQENDYMARMEHVYLIDEAMGSKTDLMMTDYRYEAEAGTVEGRFFLQCVIKKNSPITTGVENINGLDNMQQIRKFLWQEHIYIQMPDGRLYDVTGKMAQ